jgi:hypothetical protein
VHYRREIEVAAAAEPTFAYLSDFGNAAGEGEKALSDDVISVTSHEGGTRVAHEVARAA